MDDPAEHFCRRVQFCPTALKIRSLYTPGSANFAKLSLTKSLPLSVIRIPCISLQGHSPADISIPNSLQYSTLSEKTFSIWFRRLYTPPFQDKQYPQHRHRVPVLPAFSVTFLSLLSYQAGPPDPISPIYLVFLTCLRKEKRDLDLKSLLCDFSDICFVRSGFCRACVQES